MKQVSLRALFAVSLALGVMLGLETHIDRHSAANAYTSYLSASDALTAALSDSAKLNRLLASVQSQLHAQEQSSKHTREGLKELEQELAKVRSEAGLTPMSGEGIEIEIDYDPNLPVIPGLRYVNEATQLQMVVNYLQAAGAQGIAINGQRLIATSGIRSVNTLTAQSGPFSGVVQVNEVPVAAPYVIAAIGPVGQLENMLNAEGLADQFTILDQSFKVRAFSSPDALKLPGYSGVLPGEYATEVGI